jgi:peptidoglycan hydrolase-like protein with peptidoglycan-binding domain
VVAAGAVAVAAAAGTGAVALASGGGERAAAGPALPPATAEVTRADLVDSQAVDGTLGYGEADTLANRLAGTVTWTAAEGAVVNRGGTLYSLDGKPVTLMYGNLPLYRRLAEDVADGADVRQLERNLRELGYTGFTVDEEFTDATADAVREWQEDRGLAETGTVDVGQVIFASGAVRVAETKLNVGDPAGPGAPALEVTGTTRKVTVPMPVEDVRLARKNAKVTVELPGGERVSGTVTHVGTVAQQADDAEGEDPGGDGGDATIEVIVTLAAGRARGGIDQAPVSVEFVSEQRKGVLTVPVAALLALREGGYGLQVVTGGTSRLVAVETGMFADGRVEVSGTGITAGTKVGVPAS